MEQVTPCASVLCPYNVGRRVNEAPGAVEGEDSDFVVNSSLH